jgi:hypothetical protein
MSENKTFQQPLDFGDQTVEEIEIIETTAPPSGRPVRDQLYPCEDIAKKVEDSREYLRPKQELSYLFNQIIQEKNKRETLLQQLPQLNGTNPLKYCDGIILNGIHQQTLDIGVKPETRIEKLTRYFKEKPNLEIALTNFLYWIQTENFIIDSVYIPTFILKDRNLKVTGGICDAIQLIPKDLFNHNPQEITELIYTAQRNQTRVPKLIQDLNSLGEVHILEFKIGHPDSYTNLNRKKHTDQIDNYMHRAHKLSGVNVKGRLIYFSDREGQRILEEYHTIDQNFWDNVQTR